MRLLLILLVLWGCGKREEPNPVGPLPLLGHLRAEYPNLLAEYQEVAEAGGWGSRTGCDATLWAGVACYGGASVSLLEAEYSPGEWHRRPVNACYTDEDGDVGSRSTISRDQLLGVMACYHDDKDVLGRLEDYGRVHNWIMGKPATAIGEVYFVPTYQGLLSRLLGRSPSVPPILNGTSDDYVRHLQAWFVLNDYHATGGATQGELDAIKRNLASDPSDWFTEAVVSLFDDDCDENAIRAILERRPAPSYVRGANPEAYERALRLAAAKVLLEAL